MHSGVSKWKHEVRVHIVATQHQAALHHFDKRSFKVRTTWVDPSFSLSVFLILTNLSSPWGGCRFMGAKTVT